MDQIETCKRKFMVNKVQIPEGLPPLVTIKK